MPPGRRARRAARGGENLWTGTRDAYRYDEMIGHWVAERGAFVNGATPMVSRTGRWQDVAHYTQIVWRTTTAVGCATASNARDDYLVCRYAPAGNVVGQRAFAATQTDACGRLLDHVSKKGIAYTKVREEMVMVSIGGQPVADLSPAGLDAALTAAGYDLAKVVPSARDIAVILLAIVMMGALSGITYGPVAPLLSKMFPPEIR